MKTVLQTKYNPTFFKKTIYKDTVGHEAVYNQQQIKTFSKKTENISILKSHVLWNCILHKLDFYLYIMCHITLYCVLLVLFLLFHSLRGIPGDRLSDLIGQVRYLYAQCFDLIWWILISDQKCIPLSVFNLINSYCNITLYSFCKLQKLTAAVLGNL